MGSCIGFVCEGRGGKSSLHCGHPLPQELLDLPRNWEANGSLTKLLCIFIGAEISADSMKTYLLETLEKRLKIARKSPHNLMVWVQIANQLISSVLWYMLQLWPGDFDFLEMLDNLVKDFI